MITEDQLSRAVQDAMNKDRQRNNRNRIVFVVVSLVVFPAMILSLRFCGLGADESARAIEKARIERARIEAERGHR